MFFSFFLLVFCRVFERCWRESFWGDYLPPQSVGWTYGKMIDKAYLPESARDFIKHTAVSMTKDLQLFVKLLHTERFFVKSPGRRFKSYPDFHFSVASKFPQKFKQKIVQLSKRLDKIRRCTTLEQTWCLVLYVTDVICTWCLVLTWFVPVIITGIDMICSNVWYWHDLW